MVSAIIQLSSATKIPADTISSNRDSESMLHVPSSVISNLLFIELGPSTVLILSVGSSSSLTTTSNVPVVAFSQPSATLHVTVVLPTGKKFAVKPKLLVAFVSTISSLTVVYS